MCFLKAYSSQTSFKAFAQSTAIPIFSCYDKGEKIFGKEGVYQRHRISFDVSDAEWDEISGQATDAMAFLEKWSAEIIEFQSKHQIDEFYLDFPLESKLGSEQNDLGEQTSRFPSHLISLAGNLGIAIELRMYAKGIFDDDSPQA
jgi:hypothetical protein